MGPFVGIVEIICGALVLSGLVTRLAAMALVIDMLVALASTKVPILLGHGYWLFAHTFAPKEGLWAFLHESRTDLSMLFCSIFLTLVGAGAWSLDAWSLDARLVLLTQRRRAAAGDRSPRSR